MKPILTTDQQEALSRIKSFLNDSKQQVFILKGAAGSGKTTLIREIIQFLQAEKKLFKLFAPTGRAAKILRDKTGFGTTIHRGIYDFDRLESKQVENPDVSLKTFHYYYPLIPRSDSKIVIVDEASMISDVVTKNELFTFGSGQLLTDLIEFAYLSNNESKLIFIGDDAQLPPVTDTSSRALDENYFLEKNIAVESALLQTVFRQQDQSEILQQANAIREILKKPSAERNKFIITPGGQITEILPEQIATDYVSHFPIPEVGNGVVITYSNAMASTYNRAVREKIFPQNEEVVPGDIVLINNNNYSSYDIELYNGDMAKVVDVSTQTETRKVPVYDKISKERIIITLVFRDIKIRLPHYDNEISCKIIDSLIDSPVRDLDTNEMKALYIDFCIRFNEEQKQTVENGRLPFKEGSDEFKKKIKRDPYINALKVKYGYAITCHKAQGGEWDMVYVDYAGRAALFDDALRWCYTATTRARNKLIGANLPHIDGLQSLSFTPILTASTVSDAYYQDSTFYSTPYHAENTPIAKRLKYCEILEKLEGTPFKIHTIESFEYNERYTFSYESKHIQIDLYHKKSGIFNDVVVLANDTDDVKRLKELLNEPCHLYIPLSYQPSTDLFRSLYQKIDSACADLSVQITNVIEYPSNYYVMYFFRTSGKFSYIQFYYKNQKGFTIANPKSDIGEKDIKLQKLIELLKC
ncbi:energy-coupling factor transporter ATP-binding protein EcfA2 [Parabacteroides sp. PFB2-12]|uniref:ATP-dependent DNA helicase n=1 Tax=unclassified Parabacteroides TaxID=2649774 RepID=UPI0024766FDC|nr:MULTISPECIES: AAA family ATPase [unclassified Parabacteroides]MDH6342061.1 energy-coupling factor transporter ATP-binding protein EcfA2 [Parabacteroides sp. PM6-13]MDH6389480.1 energy-coupling factor transporter ATP-binding protein EcfA2 [Parabacteroides sp. PFB2-12]